MINRGGMNEGKRANDTLKNVFFKRRQKNEDDKRQRKKGKKERKKEEIQDLKGI